MTNKQNVKTEQMMLKLSIIFVLYVMYKVLNPSLAVGNKDYA